VKLSKIKFIIVSLFLTLNVTHAQWIGDSTIDAHIRKGIIYVYNLSFDSASTEFQFAVKSQPDHPAGYFFLAMIDWWKIITDFQDESNDKKFIAMLDNVIDICDRRLKKDKNDIVGLFFKGGSLGFQGRLYGNREDWLKAANCGREALPIVQKAYKLAPDNNDILLGIGIYNYYAAVIPEIYPWVKPLMIFFPKGDKVTGLSQLKAASEHARYANIEATYFLMQVFQYYEKHYSEALRHAEDLHRRFPNNVMFHKYYGRSNAGIGDWPQAQKIFNDIIDRVKVGQRGYDVLAEREANYYLGLSDMGMRHLDSALSYLYRADELCRGIDKDGNSGYMIMTNLKIGQIYDLQGKRELAVMQYDKVLDMKNFWDAHKAAKRYKESPYK
jgi:tetratricopeptide (TPR) repeat protein